MLVFCPRGCYTLPQRDALPLAPAAYRKAVAAVLTGTNLYILMGIVLLVVLGLTLFQAHGRVIMGRAMGPFSKKQAAVQYAIGIAVWAVAALIVVLFLRARAG